MNTETLSFVTRTANGLNYWDVPATSDGRRGKEIARELLRTMFFQESPFLLGHVVKAMMVKGDWGPVEIGFCHEIACAANQHPND
jgi:hypothetical protein